MGWHGLAASFTAMHSKGIVDQDIHLDNLLESVDRRSWVKTDMGNATWVKVQPLEEHFTELPFPMQALLVSALPGMLWCVLMFGC